MSTLKLSFIVSVLLFATFVSCKKENNNSSQTFYGPAVSFGDDSARSFVTLKVNGEPISIGIQLGENAFNDLPKSGYTYPLPVPVQLKASGIDHIETDWNPAGHQPILIYGVPHFDFHFYYISEQEQSTVKPGPDTVSVPEKYVPADYVSGVMAVPDMGVHWSDTTAGEFHGVPFTTTFVYGFYHGKMTFLEPMVTRVFLQTHPDFSASVKQPAAFQQSGYYPARYMVKYDAAKHVYLITLTELIKH